MRRRDRMTVSRNTSIVLKAFFDGITGAALFGKLRIPGSPTQFIDSRTAEEYKAELADKHFQAVVREMKDSAKKAENRVEYALQR
jgi:hypothetical protein